MPPMFSIITATRNAATVLPNLLRSLEEQTCRDFELIVQDAASSDSTLACLKAYQERLPALLIVSEPDSGIYDAWNRAVSRAHGEWLLFLGADDKLADSKILQKTKAILQNVLESIHFAPGGVRVTDNKDKTLSMRMPLKESGRFNLHNLTIPTPFTGLFVRTSLCHAQLFDSAFHIAGDYDFLCRVWHDEAVVFLPFIVADMQEGGVSSDPRFCLRMRWEYIRAASRHGMLRPIFMTTRLIKTAVVGLCFSLMGIPHATKFLNYLRKLRGLEPSWRIPSPKNSSQEKP